MSHLDRSTRTTAQILGTCCLAASAFIALAPTATWAAEPLNIGSHREMFVDNYVIDKIEGDARLELQQPEPQQVALVTDKPWEGNTCAYYTVFRDPRKSMNKWRQQLSEKQQLEIASVFRDSPHKGLWTDLPGL